MRRTRSGRSGTRCDHHDGAAWVSAGKPQAVARRRRPSRALALRVAQRASGTVRRSFYRPPPLPCLSTSSATSRGIRATLRRSNVSRSIPLPRLLATRPLAQPLKQRTRTPRSPRCDVGRASLRRRVPLLFHRRTLPLFQKVARLLRRLPRTRVSSSHRGSSCRGTLGLRARRRCSSRARQFHANAAARRIFLRQRRRRESLARKHENMRTTPYWW